MRLRPAVSVVVALVLAADAILLVTGVHVKRRERAAERAGLVRALNQRPRRLTELQAQTDRIRAEAVGAMDAADEILNLARQASGIPQAHTTWPAAKGRLEEARRGADSLPGLTDQALSESRMGIDESEQMIDFLSNDAEADYVMALNNALTLMAGTQETFAEMNARILEGLTLYEELTVRIDDFLSRESGGFFRSRREAADWFTLRSEEQGLTTQIREFKARLGEAAEAARQSAIATESAFNTLEDLARRLSS